MKYRTPLILPFILFFLAAAMFLPGKVRADNLPLKINDLLKKGIEKGCNLDEKGALSEIARAVELDRENPFPYSIQAMTYLFFYETSFDENEKKVREEGLIRAVEESISRAEKKIQKNPRDGNAYFALALAKLSKNRLEITRKRYLNAFREAQNIWDYLEKVRDVDPGNYDIYFPMGVLHYHLDHLPGLTRFVTSIVLVSGNKEKGLQELQLAADKADLLRDLARAELISVYSGYEKQPARVLPLAREMKEKYPSNYNFAFALGGMLSDLSYSADAFTVAQKIESGILAGTPPYRTELWPRYYHLMGKIYLDSGSYEKAAEYLQRALKDESPYNFRVRAWAWVRLGMVYDAKKERKRAEECYQKTLSMEGLDGLAKITAKQYLKTPYSPKVSLGNQESQNREENPNLKKTN